MCPSTLIYLYCGNRNYSSTHKPLFHGYNYIHEDYVSDQSSNLSEQLFEDAHKDAKHRNYDPSKAKGRPYSSRDVVTKFRQIGPICLHRRMQFYRMTRTDHTGQDPHPGKQDDDTNRKYMDELQQWILFLNLMTNLEEAFEAPCRVVIEKI